MFSYFIIEEIFGILTNDVLLLQEIAAILISFDRHAEWQSKEVKIRFVYLIIFLIKRSKSRSSFDSIVGFGFANVGSKVENLEATLFDFNYNQLVISVLMQCKFVLCAVFELIKATVIMIGLNLSFV